ncbi:alpha/beta hydrolase [Mucilaginibacter robiniae]|uniref:Alpha/beta hydrolase n=1 Tax=Mucilaginibacter robiniae TaxID=2728022 RepID=A0A7L5E8L8_9SPHI|nr:alpha/beta hydrolase [Mucilaginibacter robiniae]QJD96716.1 alpha/beta hydrolase [Mucilaginibacter robiniae]
MKTLLHFAVFLCMVNISYAQNNQAIPLYPNGVPGSKTAPATYAEKTENDRVSMVTSPSLTPFFPAKDKANGTAVIICPGGGYSRLAIEHEGYAVARKFNEIGVTAFVLKYRLPSDVIMADKSVGPLQDAQRAIQLVRQRATEWQLNPGKIGIVGFSAGGHLASTAGTHFNKAVIDNASNISVRPDFMVLLYPVITFGEFAHKGSRENLIGKTPTTEQVDLYSNEKQVSTQTPPAFLVQAQDDKTVPVQNSLLFYEALTKAGVKAEMHIYPAGGHGFGLNNATTKDQWFERCTNWMLANGWLAK